MAAPAIIFIHAGAATLSLISGTMVILMAKGTARHVALGRIFAACMLATALTSFAITRVMPGSFSPIHLLSILTLVTLPLALWARRRGNIRAHARGMLLNYTGLLLAGAFTLLPNRLLGQLLFG